MRPAAASPTDYRVGSSNGVQGDSLPGRIAGDTPIAKLAKMIGVGLAMIAGILSFDLLVLWIAAGRLIAHIPF
jgi:hypothetical protein